MKRCKKAFLGVLVALLAVSTLGVFGCSGLDDKLSLGANAKTTTPATSASGTLKVGVDTSRAPLAGRNEGSSEIVGIDVDIAAALADYMGLSLSIVEVGAEQDVNTLLSDGTIDIFMGAAGDRADAMGTLAGPYLVDGTAIFMVGYTAEPKEIDPVTLNATPIAVQENSITSDHIGQEFGEDFLVNCADVKAAFDKIQTGEPTYAAANVVAGSFLANRSGNICWAKLSSMPNGILESSGIYIGLAADSGDLSTAVTDSLRSLRDNGTLLVIVSKWLGKVPAQTVINSADAITTQSGSASAGLANANVGGVTADGNSGQEAADGTDGGAEVLDGTESADGTS